MCKGAESYARVAVQPEGRTFTFMQEKTDFNPLTICPVVFCIQTGVFPVWGAPVGSIADKIKCF